MSNSLEDCKIALENFKTSNPGLYNSKVFKSYILDNENKKTFEQAICNPCKASILKLEESFKKHYFNIRFTSYLSTSIHFNAVNFDKKDRKEKSRNQLILNNAYNDDPNLSLVEMIPEQSRSNCPEEAFEDQLSNIEDIIERQDLFDAVKQLTSNQREIIKLAYIDGLKDIEIANKLSKSQQAVSKSHQKALLILRELIGE
ncbi:RNA polymerase sigma factor [Rossellomorea sp. NPDC071047]|uniref:RNA polymerase sigma factor n=1 Tax=Rossellomorea sp. NPDC071047 TaxID=3390675 RepID=UPI003CFE014A